MALPMGRKPVIYIIPLTTVTTNAKRYNHTKDAEERKEK